MKNTLVTVSKNSQTSSNTSVIATDQNYTVVGVLKESGATKKDILVEFLIESLTLCLIGGLFGIFPAYKASLLNPIDALRTE